MTVIDTTKVDLNAPAFGLGAQTIESVSTEEPTTVITPVVEPASTEVTTEETTTIVETTEPLEEGQAVPYKRFKKFHDIAKDNESDAEKWRQHLALQNNGNSQTTVIPTQTANASNNPMPDYWLRLYGDSDASQQAWEVQSQQNAHLLQQAEQRALDTVQAAQNAATQQEQQNIAQIDEGMELLGDYVGRPLSPKEQEIVLDIVDEYTPKDANGNYLGATMPFEKAWEIHELKQQAGKAPAQAARNNVAQLSGTQSQGDTNITEQNKSFDPMNWDGYKDRLS